MNFSVKELCNVSMMIALVCICTMVFSVPVSSYGYVHFGDSMILFVAVIFGKKYGMLSGGIGSALADVLLGYGYWAPFTLVIKGLMGFVAGKVAESNRDTVKFLTPMNVLGGVSGSIVMVVGYFFASIVLLGGVEAAALAVMPNVLQGGAGVVIFVAMGIGFYKTGLVRVIGHSKG
ncbi:MAG: ECF transporter S component [Bacillota bacterium]